MGMRMTLAGFVAASIGFGSFAAAQSARLVKDIRPGVASASPQGAIDFGGTLFFFATDDTNGTELWKTDGTASGTVLVKDINPGPSSSFVTSSAAVSNGILFFAASDPNHGLELWRTDGTASGTALVKDIATGAVSSSPDKLTNVGGTLFFSANDGTTGIELWKSDGTASGTVLVRDLQSGGYDSSPYSLTNVNGVLFFGALAFSGAQGVYKSDGTSAGTVLVGYRFPKYIVDFGGTAFLQLCSPDIWIGNPGCQLSVHRWHCTAHRSDERRPGEPHRGRRRLVLHGRDAFRRTGALEI
jgi:ELWxxDGT repeat protein